MPTQTVVGKCTEHRNFLVELDSGDVEADIEVLPFADEEMELGLGLEAGPSSSSTPAVPKRVSLEIQTGTGNITLRIVSLLKASLSSG